MYVCLSVCLLTTGSSREGVVLARLEGECEVGEWGEEVGKRVLDGTGRLVGVGCGGGEKEGERECGERGKG